MKKWFYILILLLAVPQLRAQDDDFDPVLPPDPNAAYFLNLSSSPLNKAQLEGGGVYNMLQSVTINCTPQPGYEFVSWTNKGVVVATTPQYTFKMPTENTTLVANLRTVAKHRLTLTANYPQAATLTGQGDYYPGEQVQVTCTPNKDYTFQHWKLNGEIYSTQTEIIFSMGQSNTTLQAVFVYSPYRTLTVQPDDANAGTVSTTGGDFAIGETVVIIATPKAYHYFSHWERNGVYYSAQPTLTYTVRDQNDKLVAVFEYDPTRPDDPFAELSSTIYIEAEPAQAATFNISSGNKYKEGDTLFIQATLKENYLLQGWYIGDKKMATATSFMYIVGKKNETIVLKAKELIYSPLTLQSSPQGAVTFNVANNTLFKEGTTIALQANVHPEYRFDGWYIGETLVAKTTALQYTMPDYPVTLTARATQMQADDDDDWDPLPPPEPDLMSVYIWTKPNDAYMGKTTGTASYVMGAIAYIEAIAYDGYTFSHWSDGDTLARRAIEVSEETTYIAYFTPNQYQVTLLTNDSEMGEVTGAGTYANRSTVTITATPKENYMFVKWSDGITEKQRNLYVTSDVTLTAHFAPLQYTLIVESSNTDAGTVTGGGNYAKGAQVKISAKPKNGYNFVQWSDGNKQASRTVVVEQVEATYTAYFTPIQYTVSLSSNDPTMGLLRGDGVYGYQSEAVLEAIPYDGYVFARWSDGNADNPRTITVEQDMELTAWFAEDIDYGMYSRTVRIGYNTICLPHGSTRYTGARFYEIAYVNVDAKQLYLDEVETLDAGVPYLFYPTESEVVVYYDFTTSMTAKTKNGLHGTFTDITAASNFLKGKYLVTGNSITLCGNGCSLLANRAYIEMNEISSQFKPVVSGRKRVSLGYTDSDISTALDNITDESIVAPMQEGIYDILGRKVDAPTVSGFYIINGQKVFVAL